MNDLFRAEWDSVTLDDVRGFFADAGDEGLTWEAKADTITTKMVGEEVTGLANSLGGYLILGVRGGKEQPWEVVGVSRLP